MTEKLFSRLACPIDKSAPLKLTVFSTENMKIIEGLLECPFCSRYFPVIGGIPIMVPDEYRESSLEARFLEKWNVRLNGRYGKGKGFTLPSED